MALDYQALVAGFPSRAGVKARLIAIWQTNSLPVTTWVEGDPAERIADSMPRLVYAILAGPITQAFRGFFIDLATDPGDPGDLSADQTPRAGFLSALGEGWYKTTRRGRTYATTTVTIRNDSATPAKFGAFDLTFTTSDAAKANGGKPTYRNEQGAAGLGLAPGASVTVDVIAEQIGSYGTASSGSLLCVTGSFGVLTVTASGGPIGTEREAADLYRARCKRAAGAFSIGDPATKYERAANTAWDGTPLQRHDDTGPVGITRSYVSRDSATGAVSAWFADEDGPADSIDVASANANIEGLPLGVITEPLGAVGDCTTYIGAAAIATVIAMTVTAKIKSVKGVADATLKAAAETAITTGSGIDPDILVGWPGYLRTLDIGGRDQVAGVGIVPTADLLVAAATAYPGLYELVMTTPAGSSTAILLGHVATLGTPSATVTVVP